MSDLIKRIERQLARFISQTEAQLYTDCIAALRASEERERALREALEPFARHTSAYIENPETPDTGRPANTPHRAGDYRRARAALNPSRPEQPVEKEA